MNALDTQTPQPESTLRRILLLAMLPIGDTLFAIPTIQALRDQFPTARLTALVNEETASLARCVRALDEVVVLPPPTHPESLRHLVSTLRYLRMWHFDAVVDFTSPAYKWISFLGGIPIRTYLKFDRLWWAVPGTHRYWHSTHAARHYYECAQELRLPPWRDVDHVAHLDLPAWAQDAALSFLARHGAIDAKRPLVGIHAGGAGLHGVKRWPADRFAQLANRLVRHWQAHVLLLGGPDDSELARALADAMDTRPILAAGAQPLLMSFALIERCGLFIGNDSSLLHAAAALAVPHVGIFGPTAPSNFRPLTPHPQQGRLVLPREPCASPTYFIGGDVIWHQPCCVGTCRALASISVDAVYAQAHDLMRASCRTGCWKAADVSGQNREHASDATPKHPALPANPAILG